MRSFKYLPLDLIDMKKLVILLLFLIACAQPVPVQEVAKPQPVMQKTPRAVLIVPTPVIEPCVDSDGTDEFVQGSVVKDSVVMNDSCLAVRKDSRLIPLSKVVEYVCDNGEIVAKTVDCKFACARGACVKNVEMQSLVKDGKCGVGRVGDFSITKCFDGCLPETMCSPSGLKTQHITLPYQLACVVRSSNWASDNWFEFEIDRPMEVLISADVVGSEIVGIEIHDAQDKIVAVPLIKRVSQNRCFAEGSGSVHALLNKGKYVVKIGARAEGPDNLRSFRAKNFSIAVLI